MIYEYSCSSCNEVFEQKFMWNKNTLYDSLMDNEVSEDVLDGVPCPECSDYSPRYMTAGSFPSIHVKGFTEKLSRQELKKFTDGMDKETAETFYKDSIDASKDRIDNMQDVYKKVDMDIPHFMSAGVVTTNSEKKQIEKRAQIKKNAQEVVKRSGLTEGTMKTNKIKKTPK